MKSGWKNTAIGAVCEIVNGGTPKTGVPEYWGGQHRWVTPAEMGKRPSPYIDDTERKISDLGLRDSSARMLPPRSVILSSRAPIGHLVINTEPMSTNQGCKGLVPSAAVHTEFLYYYLSSIVDLLNSLGTGATFKELSGGKLKEVPIPLPPLPEQRRIVGILDEAFAGIATAKANAEKNLQNARALFESHLHAVFTHRGPGWVETKLDHVTDLITCGVAKRPDYVPSGVPFLSAKNVKNGQVIWSGYQFITEEAHRALTKHNKPRKGDILYTRVGSYGEAAIVDREMEFSVFVSLTLIKPKKSLLNVFLKHYLNSSMIKELAAASITGVGVGNLNVGAVREFPIHLPSFEDQEAITARLDALQTETRRLEALYARKLAALDELKASLLHQAFSGHL